MKNKIPKRQHFVPRTYLKNFSEKIGRDYYIYSLQKNEIEKSKIFKSNIENVAVKKNLYTLQKEDDIEKMSVEKIYANEIEQYYNSLFKILTDENKTEISVNEREMIITTVITMLFRTPKYIENPINKLIDSMIKKNNQTNYKKSDNGYETNVFYLKKALKLIDLRLKNDAIIITKLEEPNLEYITSDNPVIISNNKEHIIKPFAPENLFYLPLNSTHKLLLLPECQNCNKNIIYRKNIKGKDAIIDVIFSNKQEIDSSNNFIYGNKSALISFLDYIKDKKNILK